jgi:hypothetical protein
MKPTLNEYVQTLLQSRQEAQRYHLNTNTYSAHIALQEYYEQIVELVDDLVETYQGKYGILDLELTDVLANELEDVDYFRELAKWCEYARPSLPQDSFLTHQYDDIETLIYKTVYKLTYLV